MIEQILDNYRKVAESTMQFQQTMLRNWTSQWLQIPVPGLGVPNPGAAWVEQAHAAQRKWGETVVGMLDKHRETLDAQYRAGIRLIDDTFRTGEAKDPEQFRRLMEELWRHSFDALKSVTEDQIHECQSVMKKWFDLVSQSANGQKV
jgi:hypothetical protein